VYLRVPTCVPFGLQFYFNGHAWLTSKLRAKNIQFETVDNAFAHIADYTMANQLSNELDVEKSAPTIGYFCSIVFPGVTELELAYSGA